MFRVLTLLLFVSFYNSFGQYKECLTVPMDSLRKAENKALGTTEDFETWINTKIRSIQSRRVASVIYRIPVVVHVVHNGEPVGEGANISYEQVLSQIEVLNEDFRRIEGTNGFNNDPRSVDTGIEFYLAASDPEGNQLEEPGIDRIDGGIESWPTGISQSIEVVLKPSTIWDPERYLNIWTVNFGGAIGRILLGYAQFPDMSGLEGLNETGGSESTDGIVVGYQFFGSSESELGNFPDLISPFNLGRTTTHEIGHWLGLRHIWGDPPSDVSGCDVDDFVDDTPNVAEETRGCPNSTLLSCGNETMYENYLDYTDDACMNIFTEGQKQRMVAVLENSPRRPSEIEQVALSISPSSTSVTFYPNPALSYLNLATTDYSGLSILRLMDSSGKEVFNYYYEVKETNKIRLNIEGLASGIYFLSYLTSDDTKGLFRFIRK